MKIVNLLLFFFLLAASCIPDFLYAGRAPIPPLKSWVNDTAAMFSPETRKKADALLAAHERETTNQIMVATIPSLEGEDLEGYSIRLAEEWKVGRKGKDNGVIMLFSKDDRKIRIEVGYGLEGKLTDLVCGRIIRNHIVPHFKDGNFDRGLMDGILTVIMAVRGEYTAAPGPEPKPGGSLFLTVAKVLGLILGAAVILATAVFALYLLAFLFSLAFFQEGAPGWFSFAILAPVFSMTLTAPLISLIKALRLRSHPLYVPVTNAIGAGHGLLRALPFLLAGAVILGLKLFFAFTKSGRKIAAKLRIDISGSGGSGSSFRSASLHSSSGFSRPSGSSSYGSGSSSSGSSFSGGGGGSFGGGGASGSW